MTDQDRRHAPATLRNRDPIARVLRTILPERGLVLEIASGTGEHATYFAGLFPDLTWQPSDGAEDSLGSIAAWSGGADNLLAPIMLDASSHDWPLARADAVVCINMIHIAPWNATLGLMRGAGHMLPDGAPLYLYGPFREDGQPLAPGNQAFDHALRHQDRHWGLRSLDEVTQVAARHGLVREAVIEMPANNLSLVFRKHADG